MLKPYTVVFSGGGALGAWEVGCIAALEEHHGGLPQVMAGASAGALNAAALTAGMSVSELADLWRGLRPKDVYLEHPPGKGWLSMFGATWWATLKRPASAMRLAGWLKGAQATAATVSSVFDSKPLEATLRAVLEPRWEAFRGSTASTALAATDISARQPHYFVHLDKDPPTSSESATWEKLTGLELLIDALMATAAIPMLFPPRGKYVDGGVVRNQPLSAGIRLAERAQQADKPTYVLLPHTDRLPPQPSLANLPPTLLDIWLGAGLEREMILIGIKNTARAAQGKVPIPICLIKAGQNLEEISGLLKFGDKVDRLIELGQADARAALAKFSATDPGTWPREVRPR